MFNRQEYEGYLELIDDHIEELQERINSLKGRISGMKSEGYETRPQAELLTNMLRVMQALQVIRSETLEALTSGDERIRSRVQR